MSCNTACCPASRSARSSPGCPSGRWALAALSPAWPSLLSPDGWRAAPAAGRTASSPAMYLLALAAGVALISAQHSIDLTHLLFGNVLAVDDAALLGMAGVATVTLPVLALIWRPLVLESLDPGFMAATAGKGRLVAPGLPDAGCAVRRLRLRGARHSDVGRSDDAAGDRRSALVRVPWRARSAWPCPGLPVVFWRPCPVLSISIFPAVPPSC